MRRLRIPMGVFVAGCIIWLGGCENEKKETSVLSHTLPTTAEEPSPVPETGSDGKPVQ